VLFISQIMSTCVFQLLSYGYSVLDLRREDFKLFQTGLIDIIYCLGFIRIADDIEHTIVWGQIDTKT